MKKIVGILFLLLGIASLKSFAQVPGITYQAVILSPDGKALPGVNHTNIPLSEQEICLKFSFLNLGGDFEYEEIIQTKTDPFGMVNVIIGKGEQIGGSAPTFDKIPWSIAAKFLEVSLDQSGSCAQFSLISKQEFTAVPFALFSVNSGGTDSESTQGKSAYRVWIDLGNVGSEQDFINSLKGPVGATGPAGTTGPAGSQGPAGPVGATGPTGDKGIPGTTGLQGEAGTPGVAGTDGLSAYQVWLGLGNTGTEANFIASLTGPTGPQGPEGVAGTAGPAGADGAAASAATFVDLSTNQTIGGTKIFTNPIAGSITGSAGSTSGNAATSTLAAEATKLAIPRAINGVAFDGSASITVPAAAETLTGSTLNTTITGSSLTSVGTLANLTVTNPIAGSITGSAGSTSGNAATSTLAAEATKLAIPRAINGVAFDGSASITVPAAAETLTGSTLNTTITGSSLTSVGTLANLTVTNPIAGSITGSAGSTSGNAATATLAATATKLATPIAINGVVFDGSADIIITSSAADVGLGDVNNTSDAAKPVSTATQTALDLKVNIASPTFTGTVTIPTGASIIAPSGLVKADVGLGDVDNTSDDDKPVSTATQTNLNLKANIASPTFTGSLEVNGAASNSQSKVYVASETSLDFSLSNLISTNASAGAFTLLNMKDGGTYTLAVTGGVSGTASFTQSGLTFNSLYNAATKSNKTALYTFTVMGNQVYFSMISVE